MLLSKKASVPSVPWCCCLLPPCGWFANMRTHWLSASLHAAILSVWEMLSSFSTTRTFCMHLLSAPEAAVTPPCSSSCISSPQCLPASAPLPRGLWRTLTASSSRIASVRVHRRWSSLCRAPTGSACSIFSFTQPTNLNPAPFLHLSFPFAPSLQMHSLGLCTGFLYLNEGHLVAINCYYAQLAWL